MKILIDTKSGEIIGYGVGISAGPTETVMDPPEGFSPDWVRTRRVFKQKGKITIGEVDQAPISILPAPVPVTLSEIARNSP